MNNIFTERWHGFDRGRLECARESWCRHNKIIGKYSIASRFNGDHFHTAEQHEFLLYMH